MRNLFHFLQSGEKNNTANRLYDVVKDLPIYDFHCHLSPKEIYEDVAFDNIGEIWLAHDHYKWRIMRQYGIDEKNITGEADWKTKFVKFAEAVSMAAGNPLYDWANAELNRYFGVEEKLTAENADEIWERANAYLREKQLSPRKMLVNSDVKFVGTTDDPTDLLEYHEKLKEDVSFPVRVSPSFRADRLLLVFAPDYMEYLKKLSQRSGITITDLDSFKAAIANRLDYFVMHGCRFTDVGIEHFPRIVAGDDEAGEVFEKILNAQSISAVDYSVFLGNMFVYLGVEYDKRNLVMQWHIAVKRNANSVLYRALGADAGGDCVGERISGDAIIAVLDAIQNAGGLPKTILYTMNHSMLDQLTSIAGSFPGVMIGAAWWMCDHKRGIAATLSTVADMAHIATFPGMVTDSRSFTSYERHNYFRKIVAGSLSVLVDSERYPVENAEKLMRRICCDNAKQLIEGSDTKNENRKYPFDA